MGKVIEKIKVRNDYDVNKCDEGLLDKAKIRNIEVEAIVDTGAAYLCLPPDKIAELGIKYSHSREVKTANGRAERKIFSGAEITIKDRTIRMDIMENDKETPPLIGYLILEATDFVVDTKSQKIIGNPENDGKWVIDLY